MLKRVQSIFQGVAAFSVNKTSLQNQFYSLFPTKGLKVRHQRSELFTIDQRPYIKKIMPNVPEKTWKYFVVSYSQLLEATSEKNEVYLTSALEGNLLKKMRILMKELQIEYRRCSKARQSAVGEIGLCFPKIPWQSQRISTHKLQYEGFKLPLTFFSSESVNQSEVIVSLLVFYMSSDILRLIGSKTSPPSTNRFSSLQFNCKINTNGKSKKDLVSLLSNLYIEPKDLKISAINKTKIQYLI